MSEVRESSIKTVVDEHLTVSLTISADQQIAIRSGEMTLEQLILGKEEEVKHLVREWLTERFSDKQGGESSDV